MNVDSKALRRFLGDAITLIVLFVIFVIPFIFIVLNAAKPRAEGTANSLPCSRKDSRCPSNAQRNTVTRVYFSWRPLK